MGGITENVCMGKLIDPTRRQRAREQRVERKKKILEVSQSIFARMPYVEVTLDAIGQSANVNRGAASMYFGSKEELFLLLVKKELESWYGALEERFSEVSGPLDAGAFADLLATSLVERNILVRYLSILPVVLEQNMEVMEVFRFQRWRLERMVEVARSMESASEQLEEGEGLRLLNLLQLVTAGLDSAANPRGSAAFDRGNPDFQALFVDLEAELKHFVAAHLSS